MPKTCLPLIYPCIYLVHTHPVRDFTPQERKTAEQTEINGWKDKGVHSEVSTEKARALCRKGDGALITSRFVYTRKPPTPDYPAGRPKARCVARGFQDQRQDIDSNSPAASGDSRRCFISIAHARRLCVNIADVKQAYLNADLTSQATVFLVPPTGFTKDGMVWRLNKAVYGLADAGALWYECISSRLQAQGWKRLPEDPCIYVRDGMMAVLYVDDLLVAAETHREASGAITALNFELGKGRPIITGDEFAGVTIEFGGTDFQTATDLVLTQHKYAEEVIPDPVWTRRTSTPLPVRSIPPKSLLRCWGLPT